MTASSAPRYPEERRLATVLFADIQGFTQISEQLDFELVSDLIKAVWQRVDAVLEQHGGYIDKHIGDAVMAVWGAPRAAEDDAERAVTAAVALQSALREFAAHSHRPGASALLMRVGVNTGPVLAGYVGTRGEYTVMGDTVNVASRLETSAEPGAVVISESTYRLVRGAFRVRPLPPLAVKGKSEPLAAYLVDGSLIGPLRPRYRGGPGLETRMVARDGEMVRLNALYLHARTSRRPVLACVEGEMGLGKSRLLMEFTRQIELNEPGLTVLSARCLREFRHAPFYLWKSLWFTGFGLTDDDPPEAAREKFLRAVQGMWGRQLGPHSSVEAAHLIGGLCGMDWPASPYLAALSGQPSEVWLKRAFELTRELIRRVTLTGPVLVTLDDLQWMDEASRDLLLALVEPGPEPLPLLIVGGIRAGRMQEQPRLAETATTIALGPLPVSAEVVAAAYPRLAGLPLPVLTALAERADGNPYFMEEMVKNLVASGLPGEAPSASLDELVQRLPESLQALLQARLDALSGDARAVALLASVVGRVFWVGAVEAAAVQSAGTGLLRGSTADSERLIRAALPEIVQAELAFPRVGSVFTSEQEYIFKHSLLRDVAYGLLPHKYLRQYHLAVARWLAARTGPDLSATVAAHLEMAGENREAARCYLVAGDYAAAHGADDEAEWLRTRAREIANRPATGGPIITGPLRGTGLLGPEPRR